MERTAFIKSAPGWTRTSDHRIRNPVLYPTELRVLNVNYQGFRKVKNLLEMKKITRCKLTILKNRAQDFESRRVPVSV